MPDRRCTPGARNPKVKPSTLATTICKPGYTASIRPPSSVTAVEKRANAVPYHYRGSLRQAEYDHLIPLELGGDPNDRSVPSRPASRPGCTPKVTAEPQGVQNSTGASGQYSPGADNRPGEDRPEADWHTRSPPPDCLQRAKITPAQHHARGSARLRAYEVDWASGTCQAE